MLWFFWLLLAALAGYLILLVVRALRFKPRALHPGAPRTSQVPEMPVALKLSELLKIPTVSNPDRSREDAEAFAAFPQKLDSLFPLVTQNLAKVLVGERGIVYRWQGQEDAEPRVLMSHYDVVPAEAGHWSVGPFSGEIKDGFVWGRGAIDTKCTLMAALEAAERLLQLGYTPRQDIYFCFAGDEEVGGPGAPEILATLQAWGVNPAFVLDEGGALSHDSFPGVKDLCALIGVGEKGMCAMKVTAQDAPGHASTPSRHTALGRLARGIVRMERCPWPIRLTPPVKQLIDTLGRQGSFLHRLLFANVELLKPFIWLFTAVKGGSFAALLRTTCAFTMAEASRTDNVLPSEAQAVANIRILSGESAKSVRRRANRVLRDKRLKVEILRPQEPSALSRTDDGKWAMLRQAVEETWPEAIVSPTLMVACTDSRHYSRVCENVYRFSGVPLDAKDWALVHGHDERVKISALTKLVSFYENLIRKL